MFHKIILRQPNQDVEVCTVKQILSKRFDQFGRTEYLVSWVEYPNADTWESLENLLNVKNLILDYENKQR